MRLVTLPALVVSILGIIAIGCGNEARNPGVMPTATPIDNPTIAPTVAPTDTPTITIAATHVGNPITTSTATSAKEDGDRFMAISVGHTHNCALREDGTIMCWGSSENWAESTVPEGRFVAITSGSDFSCALQVDSSPVCWGVGSRHGPGKADISPPSNEKLSAISAGFGHVCGIRTDGSPICWGDNAYGQTSAPSHENLVAITGGFEYSCGIQYSLTPICWGEVKLPANASADPNSRFITISGGYKEICGLDQSGSVVCWNRHLGEPYKPLDDQELAYLGSHISYALSHQRCGIRSDRSGHCWFFDWRSSVGIEPIELPSGAKFLEIGTGLEHVCALRVDRTISCWGRNTHSQGRPPLQEPMPTPLPSVPDNCRANLVIPAGFSCTGSYRSDDYRFEVSDDGLGLLYGPTFTGDPLIQSQYGFLEESFWIINGNQTTYIILKAHANPEGSWTIDVFGNQGVK